ncbi:hypothetical protein H0H92_014308, partial [Tricholoma furcatifolium]
MASSDRRACWCTTCRGALVSYKTFYNHRHRPQVEKKKMQMSFGDWLGTAGPSGDEEAVGHGRKRSMDDEDGREHPGPRKQARLPSVDVTDLDHADQTDSQQEQPEDLESPLPGTNDHETTEHTFRAPSPVASQTSEARGASPTAFSDDSIDEIEAATARANGQAILDAYDEDPHRFRSAMEEDEPLAEAHIDTLRITQEYIRLIQNASLDEDKLDEETLYRLRNPTEGP